MAKEQLDGGAVAAVAALARKGAAAPVTIGGKEYATEPVYDPRREEPEPCVVGFATLQSFCDYVLADPDKSFTATRERYAHVESPVRVSLRTGTYGDFHQRGLLAVADAVTSDFEYGTVHGQEQFVIALLTSFEPTPERDRLFRIVGNLKAGVTQTRSDDGVSQEATMTKGLRMERGGVVNPFELKPYRTFAEVEQPASAFWLRLGSGGESIVPTVALYECDGGRWRLDAISYIKGFLRAELGERVGIYG